MCCIPHNSARINVMHSQWINIGGYNWAGFGLVFIKVRITSHKLRGQEWSRDNGAKNVSKKTIACLSFIMQKRLKVLEKRS